MKGPAFLAGGGEAGELARSVDWSRTALGPVEGWSQALRSTAALVLNNHWGMLLWWGPEFVSSIYNDAYRPVLGAKHPRAMGQPLSECWTEVFHIVGPMAERPFLGGPASTSDDLPLLLNRKVPREEAHFSVAYSPVPDETIPVTGIGGVLATVTETTEQVFGNRQLRTLQELSARSAAESKTAEEACTTAISTLGGNALDVPFALLYLADEDGESMQLVAHSGFEPSTLGQAAPARVNLSKDAPSCPWPLQRVARQRAIETVDDLSSLPALPLSPWSERPRSAIVLPLASPDQPEAYGVLVCGVSPHRVLDDGYRTFFELAAAQIVTSIRNARAYAAERQRAEKLAELDRAKTTFFSNVSHELRTPLTLLLGPLQEARARAGALEGENLNVAGRNAARLLKLVNNLLEFSRIEAHRARATYVPTDLATLTADLASSFRSAVEKAGIFLTIDCPPLAEPVWVDRAMWEKVALNLLSNAFKFTFHGHIAVRLRPAGDTIELTVEDTGVGIPPADVPHIFERFHRVEGSPSRTYEGTGIGLSLVQELVRLHGGHVRVESVEHKGTTFTVTLQKGHAHLPAECLAIPDGIVPASIASEPFVEEALRWIPEPETEPTASGPRERILLANDNADMRAYLRRLLSARYEVETVADGIAALEAARARRPDLILSDVMMPRMDGLALARERQNDPVLHDVPLILLSARAGQESRIEGLATGVDDYLEKPFAASELLERVASRLEIARVRRQAANTLRESDRRKDEFIATLSHELRNPLAPLCNALRLLNQLSDDNPRVTPLLEMMDRQVNHLVRLVDDLLDMSRINRGTFNLRREQVDLATLVNHAVETSTPFIEKAGHQLEVDLPEEPPWLHGDPVRLAQIISNLLNNAARFTERGGHIRVATEAHDGQVRISVEDSGRGFSQETGRRIFEMFAKGESSNGLGIGLWLARQLAEMHGGTLEGFSQGEGAGARFTVRLPLAIADSDHVSRKKAPYRSHEFSAPGACRVLVADDNADAAESLAALLRAGGNHVSLAFDGEQAVEAAQGFHPDVALLDIGMPKLNGYQVARRIRDESGARPIKIVALTGWGQEEDRRRAREAGFDAHLVKPIDFVALRALLSSVAAQRDESATESAARLPH